VRDGRCCVTPERRSNGVSAAPGGKKKGPDFPSKKADFGAKKGHFAPKSTTHALIPLDLGNENLWKS
jgi:hypothetical protein